jgi:putative peptide zinc metalloprotease protein
MDASSSWEFRDKWKRMLVASAGMIVEFFIAALAILMWVRTGDGLLNRVAYNTIVIASVSTVLFNINPLLRFDGYHILCDWLEMPNLGGRAQRMAKWLVDRFLFGVPPGPSPAASTGQAIGLTVYQAASLVYRMFLLVGILLFISTRLLVLGVILAVVFGIVWLVVPVLKATWHVLASPALSPVRARAAGVYFGGLALVLGFLALVPMPAHFRTDGVVAAQPFIQVFTPTTGRLVEIVTPSGALVGPGAVLLRFENFELERERESVASQLEVVEVRLREARAGDAQREPGLRRFKSALEARRDTLADEAARLVLAAPAAGRWLAPDASASLGMVVPKGRVIGLIAGEERHAFAAVVDQADVARVFAGNIQANEVKIRGQEHLVSRLVALNAIPAERGELPSAALGMLGGGTIGVDARAGDGLAATEPVFEIRGEFPADTPLALQHGQRGVVRYALPWEPYLQQWIREIRQLFQRKYRV